MKYLVAFFLLAIALQTKAVGTEIVAFDGVWWATLTRDEQLVAVAGMLSGFEAGYAQGTFDEEQPPKNPTTAQSKELVASMDRIAKVGHAGSGYSFATIADRISAVYRDHPKLAKFPVSLFYTCATIEPEGCETAALKDETALRNAPAIP